MITFLIYEAKVAVALAIFYMFFRLLLKKETFHRFNRVVLLGATVLSFLLPFCIITVRKVVEMPPIEVGAAAADAALAPVAAAAPAPPWWQVGLAVLFFAGVAFVLFRLAVSILSIRRVVRKGEVVGVEGGCKVIVTERDIDPFSWMKYIVLSRKDWEGQHAPIIAHEKAHIAYRHSVDLLLVDFMSALQWFNPAIWMLRADLQELHEYEADDAVLRGGTNLKEYQYLLIRKAVSKSGYSVANSFNHSILKNRITMMSKSKSSLKRGLRVLYLLPLVCVGLSLQAQTVFVPADKGSVKVRVTQEGAEPLCILRQASGEEKEISQAELAAIDPATIESMEVLKDAESTAKYGDKGKNGVVIVTLKEAGTFSATLNYKDGDNAGAGSAVRMRYTGEGEPNLLFIVREPWGEEKEISRAEFEKIDPSRINSMEVLKDADAKAKYGDKAKNGVVILSLKRPQELEEVVVIRYKEDNGEPIPFYLMEPDTMPKFQGGGMNEFSRWLSMNLTPPKGCDHSGTIEVGFVVDNEGDVRDVKILKSVCAELDAVVLATVAKSPKWEPASSNGKPVAQALSIPVVFTTRYAPKK